MITDKLSLNGEWRMYYYSDKDFSVDIPEMPDGVDSVSATVPGNVEISLAEAGVIDKELFKGMKTEENRKFEEYHWWYTKDFEYKRTGGRVILKFGAVDCIAEYFINGRKLGESDNAFVPVSFDITDFMADDGANTVWVHIKPVIYYAYKPAIPHYISVIRTGEQSFVRKPAHSFGWDIFPRAVSAGIWKDTEIFTCDGYSVTDFGYVVESVDEDKAVIKFYYDTDMPYDAYKKDVKITVRAVCGEHEFGFETDLRHYKSDFVIKEVKNPKVWWPYGYGDANVYDVTYELTVDGEVKDCGTVPMGIRTVKLERTDTMLVENHCFKFVVNGVDVMCKGSNWVPLDAYHSRDKERYAKALELFTDTHCNITRVWGGGVYEQPEFYDYCDRHGIMVWQDFMLACIATSLDDATVENVRKEAEYAVRTLRNHPSIILWAGDNEIDEAYAMNGIKPSMNVINRKILPEVVNRFDTSRPYLASSPYLDDETSVRYPEDIYPERHLWGSRDYFKADFYRNSKAHFVSETGYHGCPCRESVEKIVDSDSVWPIFNEQWALHSSDQLGSLARVNLMAEQIIQLFGFSPDNLDDFITASQISQAEAKKFFIERIRIKKPYTSGVIWWNMIDGWPQMSDAVVDYFYQKKLAYGYIKRSQEPIALMIDEMADWHYTLVVSNDTLMRKNGTYKVYDIDTGKVLADGDFTIGANSNKVLDKIRMYYSDKKFLVIEWEIDGKTYYNHYLCGMPGFDFGMYKAWLEKYMELTNL